MNSSIVFSHINLATARFRVQIHPVITNFTCKYRSKICFQIKVTLVGIAEMGSNIKVKNTNLTVIKMPPKNHMSITKCSLKSYVVLIFHCI